MELRSAARDGLSVQLYFAFVFAARECVRQALLEIGATTASTRVFASASGDFERGTPYPTGLPPQRWPPTSLFSGSFSFHLSFTQAKVPALSVVG
jgi:hypothetical protein